LKCLIEERPERGRECMDEGHYILNFKSCAKCGKRDFLKYSDRKVEEEDDGADSEETVTFNHVCECGHVVAEHYYSFVVNTNAQELLMECVLCGKGTDTVLHSKEETKETAAAASKDAKASSITPKPTIVAFMSKQNVVVQTARPDPEHHGDEWETH